MPAASLILYGTHDCPLCDRAEALLRPAAQRLGLGIEYRDIAYDDSLAELETRIPVIERSDNHDELGWPFTPAELYRFLL